MKKILLLLLGIMLLLLLSACTNSYDVWACHDGCYEFEGLVYNHSEMDEPSELYDECAVRCWKIKEKGYLQE